jgi:hypothetical protein
MSSPIYVQWDPAGLMRIRYAVAQLEQGRARQALQRAINHTGRKTYTAVRRSISKHSSLPQKVLESSDGRRGKYLSFRPASGGQLEFIITGSGAPIRIKNYSPKQLGRGYSFKIWGKNKRFTAAFQIKAGAKWGGGSLKDSNFYMRVGKSRFPLHAMFGATVSKEIIKQHTTAVFHSIVNVELPLRAMHEVRWLTRGVFT